MIFTKMKNISFIALTALVFSGCATVHQGNPIAAATAREAKPSDEKTIVYFCREWAYAGGAVELYPVINGKIVATLPTKTYTRIELTPGEYEVALAYSDVNDSAFFKALARSPVKMEAIAGKAGEIRHYWIGMAGSSLFGGSLTIDHFDSAAQARACIDNASYVDPR